MDRFLAGQNVILERITAGDSLSDILTEVVALVESQSGDMACSILLLDADGLHLRHGAAVSLPEAYVIASDGIRVGPNSGSCGTAAYYRKPITVRDIQRDPLFDGIREFVLPHGLRACWSQPILSRKGDVFGTFAVYYRTPRGPFPEEERMVEVAAQIASVAIDFCRTERSLRESEERSRAILRAIPDAMFLLNSDFVYLDCHIRSSCHISIRTEDLIGKNIRDVLPPKIAEMFIRCFRQASETGEPQVVEYERPLNGHVQYNEARIAPTGDNKILAVVRDVTERKLAEQALRERECELRASNEKIRELAGRIMTAQEEERRRISRELHDDVNQQLAALTIMISHIKRKIPAEAAFLKGDFDWLLKHSVGITESVRRMSHELHPTTLEHIGLAAALRAFVTECNSLENTQIQLNAPETVGAIQNCAAVCLYRVAQESVRNMIKHSGTSCADVTLSVDDEFIRLQINDCGSGFDVKTARNNGGLGLVSMEERVRLLQGSLRISSEPGSGTMVEAEIPLQRK